MFLTSAAAGPVKYEPSSAVSVPLSETKIMRIQKGDAADNRGKQRTML